VVEVAGDTIIEYAGEGSDTVSTALTSYTLRTNVENLTYTGTASFGGVGTAENNRITGGGAADTTASLVASASPDVESDEDDEDETGDDAEDSDAEETADDDAVTKRGEE